MYMVAGERTHLYITHSKDVAAEAAAVLDGRYEEYENDDLFLDFGGVLVNDMRYIRLQPEGLAYHFLAHHLSNLMLALNAGIQEAQNLGRNYVSFLGYPLGHLMSVPVAQTLRQILRDNWNDYRLLETANVQLWERAVTDLSGSERVNVERELASMNPEMVN